MALESKVYNALTTSTALNAQVGSRIFPIRVLEDSDFPVVTFRRHAGDRLYDLSGYSTSEHASVELTVYATAVTARRVASDAAISALTSSTEFVAVTITGPTDSYDDITGLYARSYSVNIWNRE